MNERLPSISPLLTARIDAEVHISALSAMGCRTTGPGLG